MTAVLPMQNEFPLRPIEKPSFSELALTTEEHVSIVPALSTGGLNNAKADKLETSTHKDLFSEKSFFLMKE